jgi:hypothetical protein
LNEIEISMIWFLDNSFYSIRNQKSKSNQSIWFETRIISRRNSAYLKFSAELFLFVIVFTFSFDFVQLFFIFQLLSSSFRHHYYSLSFFINHHDAIIVKSWSTKKRKLLKKETLIKFCCVTCASLNRKKNESRKNSESKHWIFS